MFKWKEEFSVGVDELDNQHKKLFEIGSKIYETFKSNDFDKYDQIMHLLEELHNYTVHHFNSEEKLLIDNNIDFTKDHKEQHEDFIYKLYDLKSTDIDTEQNDVLLEVLDFVSNWISSHILKTDMKYKGLL